jgi:hypothetical protein
LIDEWKREKNYKHSRKKFLSIANFDQVDFFNLIAKNIFVRVLF